jgi:hypothetical protein
VTRGVGVGVAANKAGTIAGIAAVKDGAVQHPPPLHAARKTRATNAWKKRGVLSMSLVLLIA